MAISWGVICGKADGLVQVIEGPWFLRAGALGEGAPHTRLSLPGPRRNR